MAIIDKPSDYFNTKLYTGTGASQSITGVGFQPDWVWLKNRNTTNTHEAFDSVRGATKTLYPDRADAEYINATGSLTSFNSDGFTVGGGAGANGSGNGIVSWNWLASNTTASNTNGSITSTVSANTTSGFSIVSYTGTGSNSTIGHGLNSAPQVVLIKERNGTNNWLMSHQPLSASLGDYTRFMTLNSTSAVSGAGNVVFQNSAFTSSVFNVGTSAGSNGSGQNFIAYCFAEKQGFSKFGSYTGNGGNQFIYTGFKPAFVIEKRSSNASEWDMYDNKRNTFNSVTKVLKPNASDAEATYGGLNFLSNGFEAKGSLNDSGQTLIYMCFAENPFVSSTGVPATAR